MSKTVAAETAVDETIPVAELLPIVSKHAEENDWCETVEGYLVQLGLKFAYDPERCWCSMCAPDELKRFTLAADSPPDVPKAVAIAIMGEIEVEWGNTSRNFISEAAARFGLKAEATS